MAQKSTARKGKAKNMKPKTLWLYAKALFQGNITIRNLKLPKAMLFGILGVVLLYLCVAGTVSTASPLQPFGDTRGHIDYVWRLYNGDIPKRTDGVRYPPFVEANGRKDQAQAANPPLFYALQAPFIGPLLNSGKWQKAIAVGRVVNLAFGVICIAALAWAGWIFGGNRKALFAVAVPALAVLMYRFTRLNVDFAIDALLVLLSTLTFINIYKILQFGLKRKYIVSLTALSLLGMATKAPYVVLLFTSFLAVVIASVFHGRGSVRKKIVDGSLLSLGIFIITVVAIGWFYYFWNYKAHGDWFTARPDNYTGGRVYKSLGSVLTGHELWGLFYASYAKYPTTSIAILSFSIAGYLNMQKTRLHKLLKDRVMICTISLMILCVLGIFATQLVHAVGIGSVNFRYMLPVVLPISLFMAYGLLELKWVRGQLVSFAVLSMAVSTLYYLISAKNLPPIWIFIPLLLMGITGITMLAGSLFVLSLSSPKD